jgi:antitoxin HigA-1
MKAMMLKPVHPGRILKREMTARGLSANRLALNLHVPSGRITAILNGQRTLTADTALRLARYFGNSPRFWLNLQCAFDLATVETERGALIEAEIVPAPAGA